MRKFVLFGVLLQLAAACERQNEGRIEAPAVAGMSESVAAAAPTLAAAPISAVRVPNKLFLDEHDAGPGKLTAEAVAGAHQKDLAIEEVSEGR